MYAIVDIAGQQFKVEKDQKIFVHRQKGEEGSNLFFDKVLLIDNGKKITVGTPMIPDALISASIVTHLKADKVKVFKKKRRKGYQILKGHRQLLTEIQINDILEKGGSKAMIEAATTKPAKETVGKGKKVKETGTKVEKPAEKVSEIIAETEPAKKPTAKASGKTRGAGKKDSASQADKTKGKTSSEEKSPKKSKTAKEAPVKKAKK